MSRSLRYTWFPFTIFLISTLLFFSISIDENLWHLGDILLAGGGDGLKNYYTFSYFYTYGQGIMFNGMLYPYGDLAIYTDAQPLIVWILQSLRLVGLDLSNHLLLVLNFLPILSFPVAGVFLCRIGQYYGLPVSISTIAVIFCLALSPQVFRLQSHYALAYVCIFPMYWFLHIQYRVVGLRRNIVFLVLLALCVAFIHPYHMFMLCLFMMAYVVVGLCRKRNVVIELMVAISPIILFLLIMTFLDQSNSRPANPYGLLEYKTEISDLLPFYGVFSYFTKLLDLRSTFNEGYAYPGVLFIILLISALILLLQGKASLMKWSSISLDLRDYFLASLLVLAFAMGLHIILTGGYVLDFIGPLKQFRGLGRTSWPFYYVCFMFSVVWFYSFIKEKDAIIKYSIMFVVGLFYLLDAISYHKTLNENIVEYKSVDLLKKDRTISDLLTKHSRSPVEFQALITLPSSTEGAEKISFDNDWYIKQYSLSFSAQTGVPLTACIMSRTPLDPVLKILEISSSNYVQPRIVRDLSSDQPFLVIIGNKRKEEFFDVLGSAEFIGSNEIISIYSLSVDGLTQFDRLNKSIIDSSLIIDPLKRDYADNSAYYFNGFEESLRPEPEVMLGKGAYLLKEGSGLLMDQDINIPDDTHYTLSLWYLIQEEKSSVPSFKVEFSENQSNVMTDNFRDWDFERVEVYGRWIRMIRNYTVPKKVTNIKVKVYGEYTIVDNLLFCKNNQEVFFGLQDSTKAYYNHHIVNLASPNIPVID